MPEINKHIHMYSSLAEKASASVIDTLRPYFKIIHMYLVPRHDHYCGLLFSVGILHDK